VRFALRHAKTILVPSAFTKSEILDLYPSARSRENDLVVIHHGFDRERYFSQSPEDDSPLPLLDAYGVRQPYFLYVGRLQEKKNVPRIVEAFAEMMSNAPGENIQLVLAGQPDYGYERILSIIHDHRIEQRVKILGYIGGKELPQLMRAARAFLFPSLYEGFGIPILEAQASGTPVMISTVASLPEVAGDGALAVDPYDLHAISRGLERLFADEGLRTELIIKGKKNLERFRWEDSAQATLDILRGQ
ncbi:MAG: glycosyltransferase family 1 protein, partial [bacterium]